MKRYTRGGLGWSQAWSFYVLKTCYFPSMLILDYQPGKVKSLSRVRLFVTPITVAYQAPLSMGFSRQECWSRIAISFSRGSSRPRNRTWVSRIAADALLSEPPGKPLTREAYLNFRCLDFLFWFHYIVNHRPCDWTWSLTSLLSLPQEVMLISPIWKSQPPNHMVHISGLTSHHPESFI